MLATFNSAGARDVYSQQDALAIKAERDQPVLRQVYEEGGQLPDVIGANWIVTGNDPAVDANAINNKSLVLTKPTGPITETMHPSSTSRTLTCKIHFSAYTEKTTFTIIASGYRGRARVSLYGENASGQVDNRPYRSFFTAIESDQATFPLPAADNEPAGHSGATVPPSTCRATAD